MRRVFYATLLVALACQIGNRALAQTDVKEQLLPSHEVWGISGFTMTLVLGSRTEKDDPTLPPAIASAVEPIRRELAINGFKMLDAQWSVAAPAVSLRLRGPGERRYRLTLKAGQITKGRVVISQCVLQEDTSTLNQPDAIGEPRSADPASTLPKGTVINATFSMGYGETVVVGTTGIDKDESLILLLTAKQRSN